MSSNIKAEVFRFLTVRAPQAAPTDTPRSINGLTISPAAQGPLFGSLSAAKTANDPDAFLAAVTNFKAGPGFHRRPRKLQGSKRSRSWPLAPGFTASDVDATYAQVLGYAHIPLNQTDVQKTWDSYLAEVIQPDDSGRVSELGGENPLPSPSSTAWQGPFAPNETLIPLTAPISLSNDVFPIPKGDIDQPDEIDPDTEATDDLVKDWEKYEKAATEFQAYYDCKLRRIHDLIADRGSHGQQ